MSGGALSTATPVQLVRDERAPPSDSIRNTLVGGLLLVAIFFGGFGTWAVTAPLSGAVVAPAVVKVVGNRKSVQHLDGGIVKELRVQEGSAVKVDDLLIVLDDTQARAELDVLSQQYVVLRASEIRLLAELAGADKLVMPDQFAGHAGDPYVASIWTGQVKQFESRQAALEGQRSVIREKINQLHWQIEGTEAQVKSFSDQIGSVQGELESIAPLVEKGFIQRPRLLQLERTAFGLEGKIADAKASIARFRQAIAEQHLQIAQLDNDRMTEITKELRDIQARLLEVIPRRKNAEAVLGRMEIRSPYAGRVVALNVFSVGAVIQRGDKILDIVPDDDALTIEAQIAVEDISDVHPGMAAEVQLTAYKQRIVPTVRGTVLQVSADRLTDAKSGNPYYVASISLDMNELAQMPGVRLYPGMPAVVMIRTTERTAFDYLVGPLITSFDTSFRQK